MTVELTEKEFKNTISNKMLDVTQTAEPVVDIWPYIQLLNKDKIILDYVYENELIEAVYQNDENSFHHILLPTNHENVFIVIVVDINNKIITGHFKIDLNQEYNIKTD